jgi:dTDP-4-amino-4,6-dideoxygalactose transaminase
MQIVQAPRASAILYSLLKSRDNARPWLLPANICPIVPLTFFKAGVPVEFVDISAETLHMDLGQAEGRLERGVYGGVLYAHTYGEPSTPNGFFQTVKSRYPDLMLVDDRCLCLPELDAPQIMAADVALYSTGYAKIVDLGFGGYAFMQEDVICQPGSLPFNPDDHKEIEKEYKQAIQDRAPFKYRDTDWLQTDADLPAWYDYRRQIADGLKISLQHRAAINEIYADRLPPEIQLPQEYQVWRFNLRLKNKEKILEAIFASGAFASSHYASLAGIMAPGRCPQAETLASEIINLFNDHHFDLQKAERVCATIMERLP